MPVGQTSVISDPAVGVSGMLFDSEGPFYAKAGAVQTAAGLVAGRFVKKGSNTTTSEDTYDVLAAIGDIPLVVGAVMKQFTQEPLTGVDAAQFSEVTVVRVGRMWVTCVGNVTKGLIPFIIYTGADAGKVSLTNVGGNTGLQLPGIQVEIAGVDGGLCMVSINLPAGTTP